MSKENAATHVAAAPSVNSPWESMLQAFVPFPLAFGQHRPASGFLLESILAAVTGPLKGLARIELEVMGLAVRRARANFQLPTEIARCRTPRDLVDLEVDFWRTAVEHYAEATSRVAETWSALLPRVVVTPMGPAGKAAEPHQRDYIDFSGTDKDTAETRRALGPRGARRAA